MIFSNVNEASVHINNMITKEEKNIFRSITEYCYFLGKTVVPRVAGGWVRDKLMGLESNDIDITLDTLSGETFATGLANFISDNPHSVGVVKLNPDKSKHLETAILRIEGRPIDFVSLRSESYGTTRIPNIEIGTPEEDALRRDITINTLFYNLITRKVEDYTGKGIEDTNNQRIRTPIDPYKTFTDDPLRILRVFRFSIRFSYVIDTDIYLALSCKTLSGALRTKVSNERIHEELFKMVKSDKFNQVLCSFVKYELIEALFKPRFNVKIDYQQVAMFYTKLLETAEFIEIEMSSNIEIINLYPLFIYYTGLKKEESYENVYIMKQSLKSNNQFVNRIRKIESNLELLLNSNMKNFDISLLNVIKLSRMFGSELESSLLLAITHYDAILSDYLRKIYQSISNLGLKEAYKIKSHIRTDELAVLLGVEFPKRFKFINEAVVHFQIAYSLASYEDLIEYISNENHRLAIVAYSKNVFTL